MLKNYFKITFRTLLKHKSNAFINIAGLTLGLAACIVIFLVVRNELGYDRFHPEAEQTYRVTVQGVNESYNPSISFAVGKAMRNDFPELKHISQYYYEGEGMVEAGGQRFNEEGYAFADQEFPKIFQFEWLEGNAGTALQEPNTVVLTESMARKYFGDQGALGKTIRLDNERDLRVTGVIENLPSNTHLSFRFIVSWETIREDVEGVHF